MRRISLLLLCFIIFQAQGQPSQFLFNKLSTENGLALNEVLTVWQDKKGFIWAGTVNGLQRYDGKKFVSFPALNYQIFASRPINQIIGDNNGNMFIKAGNDFGIFDPSNFTFNKIAIKTKQKLNGASQLYKDGAGNIFLVFFKNTILQYDKMQNAFIDNKAFKIPVNWNIITFFHDVPARQYWIGSDSGIAIYKTDTKELIYGDKNRDIPLLNQKEFNAITSIYIDKKRKLWINYWPPSRGALYSSYDLNKKQFLHDTSGLYNAHTSYYQVNRIFETKKGNIWMYGADVLLNYDSKDKRFYNNKAGMMNTLGIQFSIVNEMVEDKESTVWIATDGGLYSFSPDIAPVVNYILGSEDGENNINELAEITTGEIWICRWGKGVLQLNSDFRKIASKRLNTHPDKEIAGVLKLPWDIEQSSVNKKVYITHQAGYIQIADPQSRNYEIIRPSVFNGKTIRQIVEDKTGVLWFGTQSGSIVKYDPAKSTENSYFIKVQQFDIPIWKLFVDKQNRVWVGTDGQGLYCLNNDNGKVLLHISPNGNVGNSLNSTMVKDITQINDSIFALSSNTFHILNFNTQKIKEYNFYDGLSSNNISGLVTDKFSNVWIGTPSGVCRYNFSKNNFIRYTKRDGFSPLEPIGEKYLVMRNGSFLLTGRNVLTLFNPEEFNKNTPPPVVTITDIKLFNSFLPLDSLNNQKKVEFNYNQNSLTFYFSSLSYLQADKLRYYYRLKGADRSWHPADQSMSVNYVLLPAGKYNFEVRCENEQGVSSAIKSMAFTIMPPFYKTWWFISLILLTIIAEVIFIWKLRKNRRLAIEGMRAQVARDLHDDMGSTLSTINILSAMAKKKLAQEPVMSDQYLSRITDNSQRMMEVMDDIVWSIKPSNDSMQKITSRMREFATNVLEAKDIELDFRVNAKATQVKLDMAARRDFFLIFKEAVNNIAKYSQSKKACIQVALHHNRLVLVIEDNGIGFDVNSADEGNGLGNMQKRADALKARFNITSQKNKGTKVVLNMEV